MRYLKQGDCYQAAWTFVVDAQTQGKGSDYLLVHGDVACLINTGQINHAWVETSNGDSAIEVARGKRDVYARDTYYQMMRVQACRTYKPADAARLGIAHNHYGPWPPYEIRALPSLPPPLPI